jgi:type IV secretion system protein VirB8
MSIFQKKQNSDSSTTDNIQSDVSWEKDLYNSAITQRNFLGLLNGICVIAIIIALIWIQIIKSESKIEPFVIEIDKKTGLATVVDPITVQEYSANVAVKRSFVIQYIRAREGYMYQTFNTNFSDVVRVLSDYGVYYQYRMKFGASNPSSPYNVLGKNGVIDVTWKSIIFTNANTAQVRIGLETNNSNSSGTAKIDKIIWMTFEFKSNNTLTESERLINPLGFTVTNYKIEDENPNV